MVSPPSGRRPAGRTSPCRRGDSYGAQFTLESTLDHAYDTPFDGVFDGVSNGVVGAKNGGMRIILSGSSPRVARSSKKAARSGGIPDDVLDRLYGAPPGDFVATRNATGQTGQESFGQSAEEVPAQ